MKNKNTSRSALYRYFSDMQKGFHKVCGFTFIELIIVVTIIAILSVSAWVALTGETDKARDAKRLQDLATIQQALEQYYLKNSFYPQPAQREDGKAIIVKGSESNSMFTFISSAFAQTDEVYKNAWGYRPGKEALASCTVQFNSDINSVVFDETVCGGDIKDLEGKVIGWKGTISEKAGKNSVAVAKGEAEQISKAFGAEYIQNIGKDPKLSNNTPLAEVDVGFYIYATYRGTLAESDFNNGATQYQLATTLEKGGPDERESYIIGNYTQKRGKAKDPHSLIGSGENVLINGQKIGQSNPKVTRKSDTEKKTQLVSLIDLFKGEIEYLRDSTQVSKDSQKFLDEVEDKMKDIDVLVEGNEFDEANLVLDEVRDIMKESIARFYSDAASEIADAIKTAVQEDPSDEIKSDALNKVENIADIRKEMESFARNSDGLASQMSNFSSLTQEEKMEALNNEISVRRQVEKKLDLLSEDIAKLEEILAKKSVSLTNIIPNDLKDSLFKIRSEGFSSDVKADSSKNDEKGGKLSSTVDRVAREIKDFKEEIDATKNVLFEVTKGENPWDGKFNESFNDIILALDALEKDVKDLEAQINKSEGAIISEREFTRWDTDFTAEQNPLKRLELAIKMQAKLTGEKTGNVQVKFNEARLGKKAGKSGVVRDAGPMSNYTGIPYPLETGA